MRWMGHPVYGYIEVVGTPFIRKSKRPALGGAFVYRYLLSYGFTVCVACAPLATATAALGRLEVANGVF